MLTSVLGAGLIGDQITAFGFYDCCYGEAPDSFMYFELRHQDTRWDMIEREEVSWDAFLDLGPRIVASSYDRFATSEDGGATWHDMHAFHYWAKNAIVSDGAGTVVASGSRGPLIVSHDNGLTWADVPIGR